MGIQKPSPSNIQELLDRGVAEGWSQSETFMHIEEAAELEATQKAREESEQRMGYSPTQIEFMRAENMQALSSVGYVSWLKNG